jgi:hypothetical protein
MRGEETSFLGVGLKERFSFMTITVIIIIFLIAT